MKYNKVSLNHILTLFPNFSEKKRGITANEFLNKLNEEFIAEYTITDTEDVINQLCLDRKITKIIEGNQPQRFQQVKNVLVY